MKIRNPYCLSVLILLFVISCSRESDETDATFTEPDEVELQMTGTIQQAGDELLSRPGAVLPLPNGNFVVADVHTLKLHLYSSDFTYLDSAGGNGDGPGEFRRFSDYAVQGSEVIVFDGRRTIVSSFSTDNNQFSLISTNNFEYVANPDHPGSMFRWFIWDENGNHIALYYDFNISATTDLKYHKVVAYPYNAEYKPVSDEPIVVFDYTPELSAENNIVLTIPHMERGFVSSMKGNLIYANNHKPYLEIYDYTGTVSGTIQLPDFSSELTRDDKTDIYNRVYENSPDLDRFRNEVVSLMPDRSPIIRSLQSDADGRVWVRVYTQDENPDWYVISEDGTALAKLKFPDGYFFRNASGNKIYATNTTQPDPEIGVFEW